MPSHVLICIISGRVSIVHIFIPMRVSSFWKNIVNVQIWKPNMFLLLYIYFFPMRILNPNTKIKKEEPEAWMNICQLLFSYLMKIQWYKISLYRRKYKLTKKKCLISLCLFGTCQQQMFNKHRHRRNVTSHHFTSFLFTSFHFFVHSNFFGSF